MAGAPIPTGCTTCSAWFHYEDGTKDGYWVVGLTGSCDDIRTTAGGLVSYFGFPLTDLNPNARLIWIALNEAKFPIKLQALAEDLYAQAQTKLSDTSGPANDFTIVCADVAPAGGGCPPGTYWDGPTETCKPLVGLIRIPIIPPPPITVTPPPPATTPYVIPPPLPADSEGDELERCCAQSAFYMFQIATAIQNLAAAQSDRATDPCCLLVVQQLTLIATRINSIVNLMAAPPPDAAPAIDLTKVTDELKCICDALAAANSPDAPTPSAIRYGTKSIADAITNATGPNLDDLKKAILHAGEDVQVPKYVAQLAVSLGLISPEDAQVAGDPAHVIIKSVSGMRALAKIFGDVGEMDAWLNTHVKTFFDDWFPAFLDWFIANFAAQLRKAKDSPLTTSPEWRALGTDLLTIFQGVFGGFGKFGVETLTTGISPTGDVTSDQGVSNFSTMLGNASALAGSAWAAASVGGILLGEHSKHLNYFAALFALGAGYDTIAEGALGAFIHPTVVNPSRQHWNKLYRSHIPNGDIAAGMFARGLLGSGLFQEAVAAEGLRSDFEQAHTEAAFSGLNARMMIRLAGTGLFTDADIADELTFSGMRQSSQHRLILAAAYLATQPERNKFLATLERVYAAGLISDSNFIAATDSVQHDTDRHDLMLRAVQLEKQIALAKEYEAAYSREFLAGLLDAPGYQSALEGLGMQPPDVAARLFRDESHLLVTQTLGAERAARAQALQTAARERRTAVEGYKAGTLDEAGLSASLTLTGLSPAQVAAEVAYQILARSGVLRWIYGRQLPPAEATLLRQQVSDLTRQRELEFLTDAQYVSQLTALSIPPRYIQALRAGADAHISPKTKAILTPPV